MNPALSDESLNNLYSQDYYSGDSDYSYIDERKNEHFNAIVWDARIKKISRYVASGNFLDIGSSFGGFLNRARRFFKPHGIEISKISAHYTERERNISVHNGTIYDHPYEESFFSVITMIEVIEHLKKPSLVLAECAKLLKAGGLLVIQTANMSGKQATTEGKDYDYYMPGHLSYFSIDNLSEALKKAEFDFIKVYRPLEFGLIPKLKKSRGSFSKITDYFAWFRISWYHFKSLIHFKNWSLTSSMVIYAVKKK